MLLALAACLLVPMPGGAAVVHEYTSPYHHIRVIDASGLRTLYFDDAQESIISLADPLKGHFEYTEYFHMGWLWNTQMTSVLMIGLGGGSAQRSFEHYYPNIKVESVEIDPAVLQIARSFFFFKESERQKVHVADGRMYLRRSSARYDMIILDAYVQGRYGSSLPQHLATKEFFELASERMSTNGVLAYNVIGTVSGMRASLVGSLYRTLKSVFPQVYMFPAKSSLNVVMIASKTGVPAQPTALRQRAAQLVQAGRAPLPGFMQRLEVLQTAPPPNAYRSTLLTDDYAPVEGLAAGWQ